MRTRYVEVRCCCTPEKLLGWLPLPTHVDPEPGRECVFTTDPEPMAVAALTRGDVLAGLIRANNKTRLRVRLSLAGWSEGGGMVVSQDGAVGRIEPHVQLAFRSDDTPLEVLRRIPRFIENDGTRVIVPRDITV